MKAHKYILAVVWICLVLTLFLGQASANEYLPHQQNTELNFSLTSNFATSCTVKNINYPAGIITINQTVVSTGTFDFSILAGNYTSLGTYCHNIVCTDGTDTTTGKECREVTSDGLPNKLSKLDGYYILFILIPLMLALILSGVALYTDKKLLIFSAMAFLTTGLVIANYPSGIENLFIIDVLSILNYGLAFLCLALGIYEWLPEDL